MTGNLEYVKAFYYAAKYGSVTRAAEVMNLSQPAVSQSIKQLENEIGLSLFYRESRGIRLTVAGELLFENVSQGYELIEKGLAKLRHLKNLELGEVRIGASDMTLRYYLLPYLESFHERYPEIKVTVSNAPTPETLSMLDGGTIDFGVVSSPFSATDELLVKKVREIEDIFVAGRRFISYKNHTLDLQRLETLPLILLERNTSTRSYMDGFLRQNGVTTTPEFELATSDMIVQFVLRNLGIGCVVRDFAREFLEEGTLFELRFNKMIPKRSICVVRNKRVPLSPAAGKLMELLDESERKSNDSEHHF